MWSRLDAHLSLLSWSLLESSAKESYSLVNKVNMVIVQYMSSAPRIGCVKTAELIANFKYESKSDSEIVPWGKAEKYLWRGVKRPEIS